MVTTLIRFLFLSNSITLSRDKSILFPIASMTILPKFLFIASDNLFLSRVTKISVITPVIALFICISQELLSVPNILALILFNI